MTLNGLGGYDTKPGVMLATHHITNAIFTHNATHSRYKDFPLVIPLNLPGQTLLVYARAGASNRRLISPDYFYTNRSNKRPDTMGTAAVFGLGSMGYGMADSLRAADHRVFGLDVVASSVEKFTAQGGETGEPADIAGELDAAIVVVLNAAQTETVLFGARDGASGEKIGIVESMNRGAVVMACATVAPEFARDMSDRCGKYGVHYLDAPISGGSVKAANGQLSIMASGSDDAFAAARPFLDAMAETVFELGNAAGAGSAMKAVNQLLAGVHIATMAEALTFGITQGVEPDKFVEVISQCAGSSWMLENRAPHIVEGNYAPHSAVDIWLKDLGIVLDIAKSAKFSAPVTAAALQQFIAASGQGLGREDDAAVAKVYAKNAGITLPGS